MDREQMQEWYEFERSARNAVRAQVRIEFKPGLSTKRLFQVAKFPSFSSSIGWEVLLEQEVKTSKERFLGIRKEWPRSDDEKKFETPVARLAHPKVVQPSTLITRFELNNELINRITGGIGLLSIPLFFREATIGCDGTSWLFTSGDEWAGLSLTWWESLPGTWESISKQIQTAFHELEKLHSR